MKIKGIIILAVAVTILLGSCAKNAIQSTKIKTEMDSVSYAIGVMEYMNISTALDSVDLNLILMARGMLDAKDEKPEMTQDEANVILNTFFGKRQSAEAAKQAEANKSLYKDYIAENEKFLAQNKEREGITVTPSGIQYEVIKMGTGEKPTAESTVKVNYTGTTIDGNVFDSTVGKEPAVFPLAGVIPGWTEAVQLMPVGSKFKIYLPAELAYGANGAGEAIKPFSTLIFEVELLEIVK